MVNLATLTGAIFVALGNEHAGVFSNSDEISEAIAVASKSSTEKTWRLPLDPAYTGFGVRLLSEWLRRNYEG